MPKTQFFGDRARLSRRLKQVGAAVVLGAALLQSAALAQTAQVRPGETQGAMEVLALGTLESRDGEAQVDFLKRVGRTLDGYTSTTNLEACGIIVERPGLSEGAEGKWVVPLVTQKSHIACVAVITLPHDGEMTGQTIHSHPSMENNRYIANQVDVSFHHGLHGKRIRRGQRMNLPRTKDPMFSPTDFNAGPGWLVDKGQLLFQSGRGNVVNHGSISAPAHVLAADTLPTPALPGVNAGQIRSVNLQDMGISQSIAAEQIAQAPHRTPGP